MYNVALIQSEAFISMISKKLTVPKKNRAYVCLKFSFQKLETFRLYRFVILKHFDFNRINKISMDVNLFTSVQKYLYREIRVECKGVIFSSVLAIIQISLIFRIKIIENNTRSILFV